MLRGERLIVCHLTNLDRDIRHDEQVGIVRAHFLDALVGEMHRAAPLVHHEEQLILERLESLLIRRQLPIGDAIQLDTLNKLFDPGFL